MIHFADLNLTFPVVPVSADTVTHFYRRFPAAGLSVAHSRYAAGNLQLRAVETTQSVGIIGPNSALNYRAAGFRPRRRIRQV